MSNKIKPTKTELSILNIMWRISPATVRQIHEEMRNQKKTSYTTTLKMLQVMFDKGHVNRDDTNKAHIYTPAFTKQDTQNLIIEDIKKSLFGGSISSLVMQALGSKNKTSKKEIDEIKEFLKKIEK